MVEEEAIQPQDQQLLKMRLRNLDINALLYKLHAKPWQGPLGTFHKGLDGGEKYIL